MVCNRPHLWFGIGWVALTAPAAFAQAAGPPAVPEWQVAAGGRQTFEVASIREGKSGEFSSPSIPLDTSDAYRSTGGRFFANFPLLAYVQFAYKIRLTPEQRQALAAHLPGWVTTVPYEIQARAQGDPSKNQLRLMMQDLLADRFKLAVHFENPVVPVFALTPVKAGKTGPKLNPHTEGSPCDAIEPAPGPFVPPPGGPTFPPVCDVYGMIRNSSGARLGSRNTTLEMLAEALPSFANLGRPVVDQTGLTGRYDFRIEWAPDRSDLPPGDAGRRSIPKDQAFWKLCTSSLV